MNNNYKQNYDTIKEILLEKAPEITREKYKGHQVLYNLVVTAIDASKEKRVYYVFGNLIEEHFFRITNRNDLERIHEMGLSVRKEV